MPRGRPSGECVSPVTAVRRERSNTRRQGRGTHRPTRIYLSCPAWRPGRYGGREGRSLNPGSDVGGAVLVGGAEDDGGSGGDAADGADLLEQVFQRGGRGHPYLEDVVLVARDAVAGLDRRQGFEPLRQVVGGGGVERLDGHERRQRQTHVVRVEDRDVTLDHAVLLEPAHALVNRRHREPGLPGQLGEAHPAVAGQQGHDLAIDLFHEVTVAPTVAGCDFITI